MKPTSDDALAVPELLAVSYLRVSTREQAERGGTEEGFSIPAQREANARKAAELGARIVREFVDAGESARSADRPALQEMLAFIAATPERSARHCSVGVACADTSSQVSPEVTSSRRTGSGTTRMSSARAEPRGAASSATTLSTRARSIATGRRRIVTSTE